MHSRNDDYQLLPQSDDSNRQTARASLHEMEEVVVEGAVEGADFSSLPKDVLAYLTKYLSIQDVGRFAQVNRASRKASMKATYSHEVSMLFANDDEGDERDERVMKQGLVKGTYAQLSQFMNAYRADQQQIAKLDRAIFLINDDDPENWPTYKLSCVVGFGGGILTSGLDVGLNLISKNTEHSLEYWVLTGFISIMSFLSYALGVSSAVLMCQENKNVERDTITQRLHRYHLFAPQEFGVTVSFEPTQEHVDEAAQPGI